MNRVAVVGEPVTIGGEEYTVTKVDPPREPETPVVPAGTPLTEAEVASFAKTGHAPCAGAGLIRFIPGTRKQVGMGSSRSFGIPTENLPGRNGWAEKETRDALCGCVRKRLAREVQAGRVVVTNEGVIAWSAVTP